MPSSIWTPASADPLLDARREADARRRALVEHMRDLLPVTRAMNADLRRIDPYLQLVFVGERSPDDDPAIIPGRWHVVRHNPEAPDTWMPVIGAGGEYAEPTSRIFEKLADGNLWNDSHLRRQRRREARRAAEKERAKEAEREARLEEMRDRVLAATRTQVSLNDSVPWAQNAAGFNRIKGNARPKSGRPDRKDAA